MKQEHFDVIVIGGGASGLMAAGRAAERGKRVLLLEKNTTLGKKLAISGGGRCNITNAEEDVKIFLSHYGASEQFLYSAFAEFGVRETFQFFESQKLPLKVEARKRAFPETERASDVVATLRAYCAHEKVSVRCSASVKKVLVRKSAIESVSVHDATYTADAYILATGGISHPETGSTGDGFSWLREMGHSVKEPTPTIVPLKARDAWIHSLHGRVLPDAKITFYQSGSKRFSSTGAILLTHFGLSGPTILNSAGKVADMLHEGPVTAIITLFPQHTVGSLDVSLRTHFDAHKNRAVRNTLRLFLPPGTTEVLLARIPHLDPDKKTHSVTKEERRMIVDMCMTLPVQIEGLMGYDRAVVADGGVPLSEIDTRTMRSLKIQNAYIIGDLLNITRPSGGFSLQLCWTTGFVAGNYA